LTVSARDRDTAKEQKITISGSTQLPKEEIDRMVQDAQAHAQEDRQRKEEIEMRNRADSLAYQAERTLSEVGDRISASLRSEVEDKIKVVREALLGSDVTRVRSAADELERTLQRLGQEVYSQPGAAGDGGAPGTAPSGEPGTVEGEYREV